MTKKGNLLGYKEFIKINPLLLTSKLKKFMLNTGK